jgi:hypothetical protein
MLLHHAPQQSPSHDRPITSGVLLGLPDRNAPAVMSGGYIFLLQRLSASTHSLFKADSME